MIFEVTHWMALVPLVALVIWRGRPAGWRWIASAFAVSALADLAAHRVSPWVVGAVYPLLQVVMIAAVLASWEDALAFLLVLVAIAGTDAWIAGTTELTQPDVLLRTVAWLGLVGLIWSLPMKRLRACLLTAFGLGWVAWIGYRLVPGWTSWGIYQSVRAVSLGMFCWALARENRSHNLAIP